MVKMTPIYVNTLYGIFIDSIYAVPGIGYSLMPVEPSAPEPQSHTNCGNTKSFRTVTRETVVTREVSVHIQMASVAPQNADGAAGLKSKKYVR